MISTVQPDIDAGGDGRANQGKIARLPLKVREELNRRLREGEQAPVILPWLNGLESVQKVLKAEFEGVAVSENNLSRWRMGPHQDWLRKQARLSHIKDLSAYAAEIARAGGQTIAGGAIAIASGQILDLLEAIETATGKALPVGEEDKEGMSNAEALIEISKALQKLKLAEQNDVKLALEKKKVTIAEESLGLDRQRFQYDAAEIALKVLADDRAKAIEGSNHSNAEKLEMMGQHLFGELWAPKKT